MDQTLKEKIYIIVAAGIIFFLLRMIITADGAVEKGLQLRSGAYGEEIVRLKELS